MPPSSSSSAPTTSVQVALRIRPPTPQDSSSIPARFQRPVIHATSSTSVSIESPSAALAGSSSPAPASQSQVSSAKKQVFTFDQVHPPPTTQYELFTSTAQPLVSRFLEGFNCTILAYGQTSSGKTFTMTGIDLDADPTDPNNGMGIIPRAVSTIFSRAKQLKEERGGTWTYAIKGSFIEIYNEDLIDLLGLDDSVGGRREVQIREDKDGHIIWGGLREVGVRNANEVMNLLRKGTSIRRTNETDMNAQSSRSHAIFSLTLTQKKYTGSGAPPRSSSPLPTNGRSPSRLARPGSMIASSSASGARVGSPTFGRPGTPSFVSAMGRGSGLRPSSALGHSGDRGPSADDDAGEWVTIVSKFHFVDLAGSERLKRTAAAGERIKEGISINSGLLALGNVISALGDPSRAKSNTASHIPYRDSKLTRLLQDSLGGNAHTLMIACVSPAEWNASETVNTLKYANRARNIKNRAVISEREDGWDDIEWLQGTVTRLRKDLKSIKEGGPLITVDRELELPEGAGKKVLAQMTELQNNYEDLRSKFVERTEELTRLRGELGEKHRGSISGAATGTAKYEEIVGPVIEEYEKTIAAMEAELNLNRAALRHTNEMVEEKEDELAAVTERHAATELYVEELRSRLTRLTEREASTEAYVRDLEEKMKTYDETSTTSSESMSDFKREIARFKDAEAYSSKYISDLEARLARSDESIVSLQQMVEKLEKECEARRDEVESLQSRLESLRRDGESWRTDLEEREKKVKDLEEKMLEWERRRKDAGEVRARLGSVVGEVEIARKSLEIDLASGSVTPSSLTDVGTTTRLQSPVKTEGPAETQLIALQQTHTATLADLSAVTAKYRDALREISDLAAQIQEAKLNNANVADSVTESPSTDKPMEIPPFRRRGTAGRMREVNEPQFNSAGRRLFFRQAASAESLHSRSQSQSQSLSQELSSVHLRKASFSSQGTSSSHSPSSSHSLVVIRPNLSISLPNISPVVPNERSVSSLEKEIMRLQEVLKEREAEISLLEESLKGNANGKDVSSTSLSEEMNQSIPHLNGHTHPGDNHLSPKTLNQFENIRKTMESNNGHLENGSSSVYSDPDEPLERLNELMLSMAQKESHHREVVDELNLQLTQTRRQLEDLTALNRDQALNISMEIEALRGKHDVDLKLLEEALKRETELEDLLKQTEDIHAAEIEKIRTEHQEAMDAKGVEVDKLISRMRTEHESTIASLHVELENAVQALESARIAHEEAFGKLESEHETRMQKMLDEANATLNETRNEHAAFIEKLQAEHTSALRNKDDEYNSSLQITEEEYYNALTKLRGDHADAIANITAESNATVERLRQEHAGELRMAEIAKDGTISESQTSRNLALQELQEEHAAAVSRKETAFAEETENIKAGHARALQAKDDDYTLQIDRLKLEHETHITKLKAEWRTEVESLNATLTKGREDVAAALIDAKEKSDSAIRAAQEQHAAVLRELEENHLDDVSRLKNTHSVAIRDAVAKVTTEHAVIEQTFKDEVAKLNAEQQRLVAEFDEVLASSLEQHRQTISDHREQSEKAIAEERGRMISMLDDLKKQHSEETDALRKDYELLVQELEAHKVAADEFTLVREQSRQTHELEIIEKSTVINNMSSQLSNMESQLTGVTSERDELQSEVAMLRAELAKTHGEQSKLIQEASKRESLVMELERHRSVLADLQENLQKVKDEKDILQTEKNRSDSLVRDLQAQIARSASPPNARSPDRSIGGFSRSNLPAIKLPPPTPPPSVPPPPAPRSANSQHLNGDSIVSSSSQSSALASSMSSRESQPDSPSTSVGPHTPNGFMPMDSKVVIRLEQQAKQIEEQEVMIKTLNKQLTHCETDLQTHMELVATLETSLSDSEKHLRKARMQATELARERDTLNGKIDTLRNELTEAKREVVSVRRSIVEEKQSLEQRLDEERKAKERARQQLDSRMEELQRRKSKFACL